MNKNKTLGTKRNLEIIVRLLQQLREISTYPPGDLLQDDGGCFKRAVPTRQSSSVLLRPPVLVGAGWHHIWGSVALAGSGPPLLLAAGLGCRLLVHCERTSGESSDDPDQCQASLHDCCCCCCSSGMDAAPVSTPWIFLQPGAAPSNQTDRRMSPSGCCSSDHPDVIILKNKQKQLSLLK